ncbi:MAG: hypothetical protein K2N05_07685 [Muribaculaceae bacterium]|nr:hypothetical protein [Muribaculaceae bacterium]
MKRFFITILSLASLFPFISQAQEFKVASFDYNPSDLTARVGEYSRVDLDGRKCALLKVSVADDIVEAQGNVVGDIIKKGMEKWVYIAHDSKHVKLLFDKHHSLMLNFIDYNYPVVSEQMVYDVKLEEEKNEQTNVISNTVLKPSIQPHDILSENDEASVAEKIGSKEKISGKVASEDNSIIILNWIESLRELYNKKDLMALEDIFSDDALIIMGKTMIRRRQNYFELEQTAKNRYQSKSDFLANLQRLMRNNSKINVEFDNISIKSHKKIDNLYGVNLHQNIITSNYKDSGWLFLLWDFTDPDVHQIIVRLWQTEQDVAQNGLFTIDDLKIAE